MTGQPQDLERRDLDRTVIPAGHPFITARGRARLRYLVFGGYTDSPRDRGWDAFIYASETEPTAEQIRNAMHRAAVTTNRPTWWQVVDLATQQVIAAGDADEEA